MRRAHSVEQVRAAEAVLLASLPEGALMQRAAHGLAHAVLDLLGHDYGVYGRRVLLLVGSGDNGGDALYAGAVLARRGVQVEAWLLSDQAHIAGTAALLGAGGRLVTAAPRTSPDLVVDGIVGIGGRPGLSAVAQQALAAIRGVPVVAVDVPSGVDVDTGELDGPHVDALATITFGTHKIAHFVDPAAAASGTVVLVDLGLDLPHPELEVLQPLDVAALLPTPRRDSQKYTRGVVGVRAGSRRYPGAGVLSVAGANCGLAGMVRYVGDDAVRDLVRAAHPEVVGQGRVQAWVVGSGGGEHAGDMLTEALADGVPTVIDADALDHATRGAPHTILTPHAGELARMLDVERVEIERRPLAHARQAAQTHDAVVLLKGPHTLIVHPDGRARATTTGTSWLATAGAGDVLGGVIGALAASGLDPFDAASVGSWLHGAAATMAASQGTIVAGDVARALPGLIGHLMEGRLLE